MTIKGYFVYAKEKDAPGDFVQLNPDPVLPPYGTNGLKSNTTYEFYVKTVDNAGWLSDPSDTYEFTTPAHTAGDLLSPEDQAMVDLIVEESRAETGQPGVMLQITGPRGNYAKAYGTTVGGTVRPLTLDDHFRMGSSTKMFTAIAFFQAVDKGLITLDDTLEQYVPGIPNGTAITMGHMLSMRSGIAEYTAGINALWVTLFPTWPWTGAKDFLSTMKGPSNFYPGTDYLYTNSNFALIGMVLEIVDPEHRPIKQIFKEDIIDPLGLTETSWPPIGPVPPPASIADTFNPNFLDAAGALATNINDYTKFAEALRDNAMGLSPESYEAWLSTFWKHSTGWDQYANGFYIPSEYYYGYGIESFGTWFGHPGLFSGGWSSTLFFERDSGATFTLHENSNTSNPPAAGYTRIWVRVAEYLYPGTITNDQNWPVPPAPVDLGFDVVSAPLAGFGSKSLQFKASEGSTVFAVVAWDRAGSAPSVTYGGAGGVLLGSVSHNGDPANGGLAIFRMDNPGTGAARTLKVTGPGWVSAYGISFKNVASVGEPSYAYGSGTAHSQAVTVDSGSVVLQVFGAGAGGGPSYDLEQIVGARLRAKQEGTNPLLCVNTTTKTGTVNATSTKANKWSGMAVNLQIGG
ncbi:minor tail protein [Mycobacterium phage Scottish]|uniref:Minor tail protein n=3 Tax=Cheoctovirus TaxID=1623281 RepID=A0A2K9VE21_9CAUD|nr:minor tail protein with lysin activity [Mycobacterium phage Pacc40]YP_008410588.1 minor tail protein with lysin activity [Mycobacterium phage Daenerys]YP_009958256.1 minor tail protein with lysin activity [Mycobacterium phage JoeyJr]YP_009960705.1 minor tail protein with lysin activity [Mycobacterium phage OldBen]AXQ61756.1 minor tail protein [Mycobacterium phage PHappiness]QHB47484.1 minor tail protein [Mycobacterium phage Scottish]WNT44480.1 minor tail protein [Mycobacterium phage BlueCr